MKRLARKKKGRGDKLSRALKERDEALAFQAATEDILTAISRSTSDAKPVFEAIVRSVPRIFGTRYVAVFLVKGDELHLAAAKADADFEKRRAAVLRRFRDSFPQRIDWRGFTGKALRSGKVSQIAPIIGNAKATPQAVELAKEFGYNAMLVAPLMRDGKAIGAIGTTRPEAKLFDARELALFKAFAAQAVIAIENARLFNETKEALEQQTASSEILRVISSSPTDLTPVFDAILASAMQLCEAHLGTFNLYDGEWLRTVAQRGGSPQFAKWVRERGPLKPDGGATYLAIAERRAVQIADVREAPGYRESKPNIRKFVDLGGVRTFLAVPLLKKGKVTGTIGIYRPEVRPFTAKQIALVSTFANQAVIAIENVRLFNETKEALERQTATAEILKVISASPTSTQPVFESIVNNCGILFKDSRVALWQISEGRLLPRASTGYMPEPMPLDRESAIGACVLESRTIHLPDLRSGAEQYPRVKQLGLKHGYLSGVYAPLLREGQAIGAISLLRRELGAFSDKEVALLGTFADQAVIAIENARLFNETKEALEQQTTTASVLRVIAGSPTDLKPVMNAVVEKAARLLEADHALIGQSDGENIHWLAAYGCPVPDGARSITRELPSGRAILDLQTTQIEDIGQIERDSLLERSYGRFGVRTICATPLIREGRAVGVILLRRTQVRPFTEKQMSLLRTFADQAVIAIENARLFNETKEALEQQTASSEILGVISTSPTDLRPVFDAILESATRLCDAHLGVLNLFEGEMCRTVAQRGGSPQFAKWVLERGAFKPAAAMARILADRRPFHVPDAREGPGFKARDANAMKFVELGAVRTYLAVPLLKEGEVIGSINIYRPEIRPFTDKQVALVSTFANQAVIAIENVRLFNETKEALERQTATSEILKAIASSVRDVQPVFEAIVANATDLCERNSGRCFSFPATSGGW
jgi:GAF domain-containing protein